MNVLNESAKYCLRAAGIAVRVNKKTSQVTWSEVDCDDEVSPAEEDIGLIVLLG